MCDYDRLEVSSPGLDRPLRKPADFERFRVSARDHACGFRVMGAERYVGTLDGVADGNTAIGSGRAPLVV